jgi:hypothetical protein
MAAETERDQPAQPAPKRRTRLIIDISPELRRRIKIAAAERDLSVREYVEQILESTVAPASATALPRRRMTQEDAARLNRASEAFEQAHPGVLHEDSAELVRQMREERAAHLGDL